MMSLEPTDRLHFIFATNNPGKVKEIKPLFESAGFELKSLADLGLSFEPEETGDTFLENAMIKAVETLEFLQQHGHDGFAVLADDSGLCINALGGQPGVDSANFMGRETPYEVRNSWIVQQLAQGSDRAAKFKCVIACAFDDGVVLSTEGEVHGEIAQTPAGEGGFGYDPVFYLPEYGKTMAELPLEEKNKISHRGLALKLMLEALKNENLTNQ